MAPIRCCFDQTAVWHSDAARGPSTPSFNHLVGKQLDRVGHLDAERPGRLQVDDEFEFGGLQDRQVGGLRTVENLTGVGADLMIHVPSIGPIAHQQARFGHLTAGATRRIRSRAASVASWTRRLLKNASGATKRASARSRAVVAKAASISRLVLALRTCIC